MSPSSRIHLLAGIAMTPLLMALVPFTAPTGDLNKNGEVDSLDLQCMVIVFDHIETWMEQGPEACIQDQDCADFGPGSYCRAGLTPGKLCLPPCLHPDVTLGQSPGDCDGQEPETETCLGTTAKGNADMDCDGAISNIDFAFLVSILMGKTGGVGSPDYDSDAQLNFCDQDSDGDGLSDDVDCSVLDHLSSGCLDGICVDGACVCVPSCSGKECGDDGCGGECGPCGEGQECLDFLCNVSPFLLISDPGSDKIYKVDTSGATIAIFDSPVDEVRGITHDKRNTGQFWVVGVGDIHSFYKVDLESGEFLGTVPNSLSGGIGNDDIRGLSFFLGGQSSEDVFFESVVNTNFIDGVHGCYVDTGGWVFKSSYPAYPLPGFLEGYWGVAAIDVVGTEHWATNYDFNRIEHRDLGYLLSSFDIPMEEPRGMALGAEGGFWVLDAATKTVFHLSDSGATLSSWAAPGVNPQGLSYAQP